MLCRHLTLFSSYSYCQWCTSLVWNHWEIFDILQHSTPLPLSLSSLGEAFTLCCHHMSKRKASFVWKVQIMWGNYLRCAIKRCPPLGLTSCCLPAIFSARDAFPNLSPISEIFQRKIKSRILCSVCNLWNATPTVDWLKRSTSCLLTKDH